MDIRSDKERGKLLFKWDPNTDIVSISCRDVIYDVKLIRTLNNSSYCVIGKRDKKSPRASPSEKIDADRLNKK